MIPDANSATSETNNATSKISKDFKRFLKIFKDSQDLLVPTSGGLSANYRDLP